MSLFLRGTFRLGVFAGALTHPVTAARCHPSNLEGNCSVWVSAKKILGFGRGRFWVSRIFVVAIKLLVNLFKVGGFRLGDVEGEVW